MAVHFMSGAQLNGLGSFGFTVIHHFGAPGVKVASGGGIHGGGDIATENDTLGPLLRIQ